MKPVEKLKSKYLGCMLGVAIGDALGKQNEGLNRKDILENGYVTDYGKARAGSPGEKLRAGQYTDDTEQMIVLAQSLVDCNGFDAWDFAGKIAKWGADAQNDPVRKTLVGPSSAAAIVRLNSGIKWKESGSDIPSCGSAMRVAPIGLFYKDMDEIESNAALSSIPTHNSKGAIAGAVAVAIAVRSALCEKDCIEIVKDAASRASKYDNVLAKKIELSFEKKDIEPDKAFEELGTSYMVYDTVPCAFYCFSRHFEAPEKAITEAVNAGGDTDSIACMTGSLCGALYGIEFFPEKWLKGLENKKMIEYLSNEIWRKSENI
jgi:ADP-ribosyl-[dinitrogen reductase] hydrolase